MAKRITYLARILDLPRLSGDLYRRLRGPTSREEIARRCQVGRHAVAGWEYGRHHPRDDALWILWLNFLSWTKRARINPYDVLQNKWPRGVPSPDARRAARQVKVRPVTPPAPPSTAATEEPSRRPPTSREGGAEKLSS